MRVELLITGWLTAPAGIWRRGDDMDRPARLPVPAWLLDDDRERILVDCGLHPSLRAAGGPFALELERDLGELVDLDTLTRVVMTHLHFDHAGGLELVPPTVPVVVQRREWEAAHDPEGIARNYFQPADYASARDRLVLVDGDHDLLGDGSVRLLATPGHTPGHQSVCVEERTVIAGDVAHFAHTLDDARFPVFADDFAQQHASAQRLRALRDAGATVLPGHDPEVLGALPSPVCDARSR